MTSNEAMDSTKLPARSTVAANPSDRSSLAQREIPHMAFSTGSPTSLTPVPRTPDPGTYNARYQAMLRFRIDGNVIITGGGGVLGLALARGLLEHGADNVALFDMQKTFESPFSRDVIRQLRVDFPDTRILEYIIDVTNEAGIVKALDCVHDDLEGVVKHLVCCAGIVGVVPALEEAAEHWRQVVDVNLTGSFLCAKAMAKRMADAGQGGTILLTSSLASGRTLFPQPQAAYNASKAGVASLTKSLAAEWAGAGIRVNCLAPGYMDTILNEGPGLDTARTQWMSRCPLGRMGHPTELIGTVVMLCSRAGSYITGAEIRVDGGSSAL